MKALVTGGNGFLGKYIVRDLINRGDQVSIICRRPAPELEAQGVRVIRGDIRDSDQALAACKHQDVVFHVAGKVSPWGRYRDFYSINVDGTNNLLAAAQKSEVKKFVYTSSPSVVFGVDDIKDGNESLPYPPQHISHYQTTKAIAERNVLTAHNAQEMTTTALRPHFIWGAGDVNLVPRIIHMAKKGRLKIVGDGHNKASMVYIENASMAHLQAADSDKVGGKAYFVNDFKPVAVWEWINTLVENLGLQPAKRKVPFGLAYGAGSIIEKIYNTWPELGEPMVTRLSAMVLAKDHYFDVSKAQEDFGFQEVVAPDVAFQRALEYYRNNFL